MSNNAQEEFAVAEKVKVKINKPPLYNVIFHNDDYTPMEFVIHVLLDVFNKNETQAVELTLEIHESGKSVVGQYIKEIAESKQKQVHDLAKQEGHPLECSIEPAPESTPSRSMKP